MEAPAPRRHSPAAERNRGPILAELQRLLPAQGVALELASGSGQHAAFFSEGLPGWQWQPSEGDPASLASIGSWCVGLTRVRPPILLDVLADDWPGAPERCDAVVVANLLHIAPWPVCGALMRGAARHLAPAGLLLIYGPFLIEGESTAPSNLAFDADLRQRNAAWGLRVLGDVLQQAAACGLALRERVPMPANNQLLVLGRAA